jgi:hypothetical protein
MPTFTKAGLFDYIIKLIICEDKVSASLFTISNANLCHGHTSFRV